MRKYLLELAEPDKESSVLKIYSHTFLSTIKSGGEGTHEADVFQSLKMYLLTQVNRFLS